MNLLERLDELIEKLNCEILRLHNLKKKYSLTALGIDKGLDAYSKEEVIKLQLKYNLKKKYENGLVLWNTEYKEEVLNHVYPQVLSNNVGNIELLIPELRQEIEIDKSKQLNEILSKKLKRLNKNIKSHEGYLFFDSDFRQRKNNLLKNRFDVIWNINEQFLIFPLMKRNKNGFVISSAEYPFIEFDVQQWCDLEFAFHLIPLFIEAINENPERLEKDMSVTKGIDLDVPILDSTIFKDNMLWVFYEVLVECSAIDVDNKPIRGKFRPICDAIYTKGKDLLFKYNLNKKDYISYLNDENGFNETFSKLSDGLNHEEKVKDLITNRMELLRKSNKI